MPSGTETTMEEERRTRRWASKFERARVLGVEAERIGKGAPVYVPIPDSFREQDALILATREWESGRIHLKIGRVHPDHSKEMWSLDEMILNKPKPLQLSVEDQSPSQTDPYAPLAVRDMGPLLSSTQDQIRLQNTTLTVPESHKRYLFAYKAL